jgi:hypothetical protein
MKLITISSPIGKSLIFSVLVSFLLISASNISAQNKYFVLPSHFEPRTKSSNFEPKPYDADNLKVPADWRKTVETGVKVEKKTDEKKSQNAKIERFSTFYNAENKSRAGNFNYEVEKSSPVKSFDLAAKDGRNRFVQITETKNYDDDSAASPPLDKDFRWRAAIGQSLMFLGVQHGYAFTQLKTRRSLKGKFWKDYVDSIKSLHGWDDGGRFFTNYIAHPMQGSMTGFIFVQNDPKGRKAEFGASSDYWKSRMKAMAWSAAWSMQFEIGPISQASIGNVGSSGKQTWEDIVTTPTLGTAMLIGEDALDRFIIKNIERRTDNFYVKVFVRMLLNPTRNFSNMLRFKAPWHRDRPPAR